MLCLSSVAKPTAALAAKYWAVIALTMPTTPKPTKIRQRGENKSLVSVCDACVDNLSDDQRRDKLKASLEKLEERSKN